MSTRNVDVAVVGAGLGGATAAIALAQRGTSVALLESSAMPRHKVCGEFLSPEIRAIFTRLKLSEEIENSQAERIYNTRIVSEQRVLETPLPSVALALSRFRLDEILWNRAVTSGALCFDQTRVRDIEFDEQHGFVLNTRNESWCARYVVIAAGRNARVAQNSVAQNGAPKNTDSRALYVGFKTHFTDAKIEKGVVELHPFRGGYCGLVRIENGLTNACLLARYDVVAQRSPEEFWDCLLQECPALRKRMCGAKRVLEWLATGNVSFGGVKPTSRGVLHCGDAAGFIHPLTGDGMAMAARSGELAAATIGAGLRADLPQQDVAPLYERAWRREFTSRLKWGARLQPILTSPRGLRFSLELLNRAPQLARRAVALTRG